MDYYINKKVLREAIDKQIKGMRDEKARLIVVDCYDSSGWHKRLMDPKADMDIVMRITKEIQKKAQSVSLEPQIT